MSAVLKDSRGDIFLTFKDGTEYTHAVALGQPVAIVKLTPDQEVELSPAQLYGKPYPVAIAARRLLAFGEKVGITDTARAALLVIIEAEEKTPEGFSDSVVASPGGTAREIARAYDASTLERWARGGSATEQRRLVKKYSSVLRRARGAPVGGAS